MSSLDRPGFAVTPVVETWEATVYEITGSRTAFLVVPRSAASGFAESLATGAIDATISDYLATPDTGRTLDQHALMLQLGLYDRLGDTEQLAAPERHPATGRIGTPHSREDKNQQPAQSTTSVISAPARKLRTPILIGAGIAVLAITGIGVAIAGGGDSDASNTPSLNASPDAGITSETLSTSYKGTLTVTPSNSGPETNYQLGLFCQGDSCRITGWNLGDRPMILTRNGQTLSGSLPGQTTSCDEPITGESTAVVTLDDSGRTMSMKWVSKPSGKVPCADGSSISAEGAVATFTGTLIPELPLGQ